MTPFKKDIKIRRGDTKEIFFRVRTRIWDEATLKYVAGPYRDLTGWTVKSQIRATKNSADPAAEFSATLSDQVETTGGVLLKLTPEQTAAITIDTGGWDVQMTDPNNDVWTYIEGNVTIEGDWTR